VLERFSCSLRPLRINLLPDSLYFFWTGESKEKSCVGNWQRSLRRLFRLAGVPEAHPHRFRDTLQLNFYLQESLQSVFLICWDNKSVRITEKHYSPWVAARQEQLEDDVRRNLGCRFGGSHFDEGYI
jgi:integrase/recombinase XerD